MAMKNWMVYKILSHPTFTKLLDFAIDQPTIDIWGV